MARETQHPLLRFIRRIDARGKADTPDAALLERFVAHHDEDAFAELVRRHGQVVWGVCRRVLAGARDVQIAEDAFQATFLVLLRKARALSRQERLGLGSWLFGVAYRTARKAQSNAGRWRAGEVVNERASADDPAEELMRRDLRRVLDEELARLPQKYRAPVVLCYLEGKTQHEVARLLGCPRATIATRLARACERLRAELARRGVTLGTGALATAFAQSAESASVTAAVGKTVRLLAAGPSMARLVSAEVLMLTEGVIKAMQLVKLKAAVRALLLLGVLGTGIGLVAYSSVAAEQPPVNAKGEKEKNSRPRAKTGAAEAPHDRLAKHDFTQLHRLSEALKNFNFPDGVSKITVWRQGQGGGGGISTTEDTDEGTLTSAITGISGQDMDLSNVAVVSDGGRTVRFIDYKNRQDKNLPEIKVKRGEVVALLLPQPSN